MLLGFAKSIHHYGYYFNFITFLDIYEMFVLQQGHVVWINAHIALWSMKYVSKMCTLTSDSRKLV